MIPSSKTNKIAEIQVGIAGLRVATKLQPAFQAAVGRLWHVVIKAYSEYFGKGMTQ